MEIILVYKTFSLYFFILIFLAKFSKNIENKNYFEISERI